MFCNHNCLQLIYLSLLVRCRSDESISSSDWSAGQRQNCERILIFRPSNLKFAPFNLTAGDDKIRGFYCFQIRGRRQGDTAASFSSSRMVTKESFRYLFENFSLQTLSNLPQNRFLRVNQYFPLPARKKLYFFLPKGKAVFYSIKKRIDSSSSQSEG